MGKVFFIGGIDTDCGKTYITAHLAKNIAAQQISCITQKLSQTGCCGISDDIQAHRSCMGISLLPEDLDGTTCPYVFSFAGSPHLAAAMEHKEICADKLQKNTAFLSKKYSIVLLEGAGGLCVPLSPSLLLVDYITHNNYPLILVSSSKLGSINHTILSLELCKQKNISVHTLVFNILPGSDTRIAKSSFEYISQYTKRHFPHTHICSSTDIENGYVLQQI
jgi:dethiobiotin synthetase